MNVTMLEPVKGNNITISDQFPVLYISDTDEVFCYPGVCMKDDARKMSFIHPYYMWGKHSTDKNITEKIQGFYRIVEGCIVLDEYVDNKFWGNYTYKKIAVGLRFPHPDTYFAVLVNGAEDEDLTRAVFGLTYDELKTVLGAYAGTLGNQSEYFAYPKLTRSIRSNNFCDMNDLWIPEKFPYVAFSESGYEFSHVSLWGFYRHIQLLTACKLNSSVSQLFLKTGVGESVLRRLFDIGRAVYHQAKVTKGILE